MTVRRLLIFAPIVVIFILIQSYFWEPNYGEQTRGNPKRLHEFITGSIGDATILNPILSADSSSSQIESLVFDSLIDRDKELRFRGRLATSWEINEEAYFYVNPSATLPGVGPATGQELVDLITRAKSDHRISGPGLRSSLEHITKISLIPPRDHVITRKETASTGRGEKTFELKIRVKAPERIKLSLDQVEPDLFKNLGALLGEGYFESFKADRYLHTGPQVTEEQLARLASEILPATESNPVLLFHLRPGVKFQDGHGFDANDVKFTYDSVMDPRNISPRISDYEPVKAVEVIDPLTVRIVYKRLYSFALGTWQMSILPEHLLNREALRKEAIALGKNPETFTMRQSSFNRHPVGCGPFKFEKWKSDQYLLLDRFLGYWEGPPNYKRYAYRIIPDVLTQEMEFYAGTLDSYDVQPYQVKRLKEDPRFQSFSGLSFGYTYIGYNMRRKPFDDVRVRTALGMAIDVSQIIKYVLYGQGERITGPFVEQTDYYDHKIPPLPYDPQGAMKLLEEAGWKKNGKGWFEKDGKPLQFTLITNSGNDIRKAILAIAQDAWKQIGIDVSTDILEWSVFLQQRIEKQDFDAVVLGWQMGIEPDLYQVWYSSQTHPYELNFVGFKNKEADDLIIKIRKTYNHEKQVEYCHELHAIIAREQPYTFLYVGKWTAVLDKRIVIQEVNAEGEAVYKKITPTKTGSYTYYFNRWVKLPQEPHFTAEN
jgi:ABC-type transport system substrate-binding protein